MTHSNYYYSKYNKEWDTIIYPNNYTIGGLFTPLKI